MTFSDPNTVRSSRDGVVPRASYVLDPRPFRGGPNAGDDLRSELHDSCYRGKMLIIFLSILLGDDQALYVGATGNRRAGRGGASAGHDTMQPHGGELANPTTTLWLPENLKKGGVRFGFKTRDEFLKSMKVVFREVMKFGARATDVAKAFARMEFYLVQHLLFNVGDLRLALQAIVKDMETKFPLIDPLLPDIEPSDGLVPGAPYILEPQPPRVDSNADVYALQLRAKFHEAKQFHIFLSILLGEDQPPDNGATAHDSGSAVIVTDHDSPQPHGGELVAPTTTAWLPEYLKKRDAIPGYDAGLCLKQLIGLFKEVMKFGARATDIAKALARMEIDHVECLLVRPEDLRSTLQRLNSIAVDEDTRELFKMLVPDLEFDVPLDVLPDELLPSIDDNFAGLSIFHYFGKSEDERPET